MINKLISFLEDSIVSLKKEGVEPNTIFINWEDRKLLEKTERLYAYLRPACELEHCAVNSRYKMFGLDVIYIDKGPTCVVKKAKTKYFRKRKNERN